MPDRTATPEELLDQWLDALNAPGDAIPPAPAAIAGLAEVALDYRRALAPNGATVIPERNGRMHHAQTIATPNGATWRILARPERRRIDWGSWLATAAVFALLVGLVGGAAMRTWGLPGGDDPSHLAGIAASPGATPTGGTLSCASPGYRAVVEGEVHTAELASLGETETPLNVDGIYLHIPNSNGEVVTLPNTWMPLGGPMWSSQSQANQEGNATIRNVDTGDEWTFPNTRSWTPGLYVPPYLVVPANENSTDFRIIDTESGEEAMVSDLRGDSFGNTMRARIVTHQAGSGSWPNSAPAILAFSEDEVVGYPHLASGTAESTPDPTAPTPNALYLPPNLDDARFLPDAIDGRYVQDTIYASATNSLAYATEIDGDPAIVVIEPGADFRIELRNANIGAAAQPLMFSDDGTRLVVTQPGELSTWILGDTSEAPVTFAPGQRIMPIAHNAGSMHVLIQYPDRHIAIVDATTGEATDFPDVGVPANDDVLDPSGDQHYSFENDQYELFDNATGTVRIVDLVNVTVSPEIAVLAQGSGTISSAYQPFSYRIRYPEARWDGGHAWLAPDGSLQVQSTVPGGKSWTAPAPDDFAVGENEIARLFTNPDQTCLVLEVATAESFETFDNSRSERLATWIMPIESNAVWTRLNSHITAWFPTFDEEAPRTLPAQDFASPVAGTGDTGLSCASPGYVPVVSGDVDLDILAEIGATDAIIRGETTTITAANGTVIEFGPGEQWTLYPNRMIFSGDDLRAPSAVTSLATGESWPVPAPASDPNGGMAAPYTILGEWLFVPVDDAYTDWRVINTASGDERLTSDLFGAPFASSRATVNIGGPWAFDDSSPAIVSFLADEGGDMATLVLPSGDLDDAWALDPANTAAMTGVISADGNRIAYVDLMADRVIVLDGFTGDQVGYYRAPDAGGDILQPVGLSADDSKMILRDNQQVWTVDIDTGEIATVFDPGGDIHEFEFDPTTDTAIASSGNDAFTWLDPGTGETKELDIPLSMRFPQPQFGWALIQTRDDIAVDYALLDMTTGEIVTEPIAADRDENGTNVWITGGDDTGVFVVQAESGRMLVLDGPGGQAFDLAAPEAGRDGWNGVSIVVSPNGGCLVYTERGEGEEPGVSWIAPLEPDAEWTALPFELGPWIEMPPAPAEPVASPVATPAASPVATP